MDLKGEGKRGGGGGDMLREKGAGWGDEGGRDREKEEEKDRPKERERGGKRACQPRPRLHALFSTTT